MDRKIEKKRQFSVVKLSLVGIIAMLGFWLITSTDFSGNALKLDKSKLRISTAKYALLEDYIPIRGRVEPIRTVYLDAIEGGRVEEILVEEGAEVEKGQTILRLSNTNLQLDVISREAQVSEQLNNLRNTKLAIEKETLSLKSEMVEIEYKIIKLERTAKQRKKLFDKRLISQDDYLATKDELNYFAKRKNLVIERQKTDRLVRKLQMEQLESSVEQLQKNLIVARKNLENLIVKAPVTGKLTALNVELGESKRRGERLGQVDNLNSFKVSALVDEYYVTRITTGIDAIASLNDQEYRLKVNKVFSQVNEGQFEITLEFIDEVAEKLRRGQTLSIKLQLDSGNDALVLDKGGFVQDTGGNWAFVVSEDGKEATKRDLRPGKSNPEFIEVLAGIREGEQVVISSYGGFADKDKIIFK